MGVNKSELNKEVKFGAVFSPSGWLALKTSNRSRGYNVGTVMYNLYTVMYNL